MTLLELIGDKTIKMGMTGVAVSTIQLRLKELGAPLRGTGYFGPATDTAVIAFQRLHDLNPSGVVDKITAAALDMAGAAPILTLTRPLWLQAGMPLIGTKEAPGSADNPKIIEWAQELGGDIAKEYKHDSIPWCALLINEILSRGGVKGTGTLWALDFEGHWPATNLKAPAVGAIAPMVRDGGGHVICVVGKDRAGNVVGLGGNQSDAVNLRSFPLDRLTHGFWYPNSATKPALIGMANLPVILADGTISTKEG